MRKFGSFKYIDTINKYNLHVDYPDGTNFNNKRGEIKYNNFVTMEGYDLRILSENQPYLYDVRIISN